MRRDPRHGRELTADVGAGFGARSEPQKPGANGVAQRALLQLHPPLVEKGGPKDHLAVVLEESLYSDLLAPFAPKGLVLTSHFSRNGV